MKKIVSLLVLVMMLLTVVLASCNAADDSTTSSTDPSQPSQSTEESSEAEKLLVPHLGKRDLGGFTLTFLATQPDIRYSEHIVPDEQNEEPINDAAYNRNELLKSEYNCEIEVIWTDPFADYETKVNNDVLSGVNDYNVCIAGVQTLAQIAANKNFFDLNAIQNSNLSLESSWWDSAANESMTILGKLFFATGDITVLDEENTQCLYFNKDMVKDHGLDNPYQLVYDGKWTLDTMHELCRTVAAPGGDGIMNMEGDDTYGYVGVAFDNYKLIIAANCPQIERDADGNPVIAMTNERNVNAFNKVKDFMTDKSCVAYLEQYYRWNDYDNNVKCKAHFYNGQALFLCDRIAAVSSPEMAETTFNYGVLPTPKYDENQEYYVDGVDPYHFYAIAIPKLPGADLDKITFLLDATAYLNEQTVTPLYYEVTMKEKRFRDEDAPKMLDIIFENRCVDLSVIFNWNDCIQYYNQLLTDNRGVVSFMESNGVAMQAAMDECMNELRDLKD